MRRFVTRMKTIKICNGVVTIFSLFSNALSYQLKFAFVSHYKDWNWKRRVNINKYLNHDYEVLVSVKQKTKRIFFSGLCLSFWYLEKVFEIFQENLEKVKKKMFWFHFQEPDKMWGISNRWRKFFSQFSLALFLLRNHFLSCIDFSRTIYGFVKSNKQKFASRKSRNILNSRFMFY